MSQRTVSRSRIIPPFSRFRLSVSAFRFFKEFAVPKLTLPDSATLRAQVRADLGKAALAAQQTRSKLDDQAVADLRKLLDSDAAWDHFYVLLTHGSQVVHQVVAAQGYSLMTAHGFDPTRLAQWVATVLKILHDAIPDVGPSPDAAC
jgi:hypothetical protein